MEELQVLKSQIAALEAHLLTEVDARDIPRKDLGWGSTADWFTHLAGLRRGPGVSPSGWPTPGRAESAETHRRSPWAT